MPYTVYIFNDSVLNGDGSVPLEMLVQPTEAREQAHSVWNKLDAELLANHKDKCNFYLFTDKD
jgi:hypothetical protein